MSKTIYFKTLIVKHMIFALATYQLSTSLPDNMKELLPEPEEIVRKLKIFDE